MKPYSDIESDEAHSDRSSGHESGASDGEWTYYSVISSLVIIIIICIVLHLLINSLCH